MITKELAELANNLDLIVSSVWNGYSRTWIVHEKNGQYHPVFTTNEYDRILEGLKNNGRFRSL